jgi:hypothetical protein
VKAMTKGFQKRHKDLMEKPLKMCLHGPYRIYLFCKGYNFRSSKEKGE